MKDMGHNQMHDCCTPVEHNHNEQDHKGHNHEQHAEHDHTQHHKHMIADFRKRFFITLFVTIPVVLLSPIFSTITGLTFSIQGQPVVLLILASFIFFYGGVPFFTGMIDEIKKKTPGMMTLIALAISVAYIYSTAIVLLGLNLDTFFWELSSLIVIMLAGHWLEMRSVLQASNALEELKHLLPDTATRIDGRKNTETVPIDQLKEGDLILIKPGESVPIDAIITDGESYINESMVSGESKPVFKKIGDEIIGGTINGEGAITARVKNIGENTFLSQIQRLVMEAQESKSKTQNLADKIALWLTIAAITFGFLTLLYWTFIAGDFTFAIQRMVSVMVITCPHALGLAIPLVVVRTTTIAVQNGFLIRNRTSFELAKDVNALIVDKTGTLTKGEFAVTNIKITDPQTDEKELIKIIASIEEKSEHPIAKAITALTDERTSIKNFKSATGKGVSGTINNDEYQLLSPIQAEKITSSRPDIDNEHIGTKVIVLKNNIQCAVVTVGDTLRESTPMAIKELQQTGVQVYMLTGDNESIAKQVAQQLHLDGFKAEVLPQDKINFIKKLQKDHTVAMAGDGINDAPALSQSDVGIAVGAGTNVAIESADVILVKNDLKDILSIIKLSKATYSKMIQNFIWALGYNVIAIPLAAGVLAGAGIFLSPAVGAILMSLSTVIVAVNARLLKF